MSCSERVCAVIVSQNLLPIHVVIVSLALPCVASPCRIPHPVAVYLQLTLTVGELVGCVRPVPVVSLRIKVQTVCAMNSVHGFHRLVYKGWRAPSPRLEVGKNMHVAYVYRSHAAELSLSLAPWASRLICGERFARIFCHCVNVLVERKRLTQHAWTVCIVRTQDDRRLICSARRFQAILNARYDGIFHPFNVVFYRSHSFAEAYKEAHIWVFLDKCRNALACVIADKRSDGAVAVLCGDAVMVGKWFRQDDIVEHLYYTYTALCSLCRKEGEHLLVLSHCGIVNFGGKRIVFKFYK